MENKIFIMGACELHHFQMFQQLGFHNFVIENNPASFKFVSMKIITDLVNKCNLNNFILSHFPKNKEEFDYYTNEFSNLGINLKFKDDFEIVEIPIHNFNSDTIVPKNKILFLSTSKFFLDERTINTHYLLSGRLTR